MKRIAMLVGVLIGLVGLVGFVAPRVLVALSVMVINPGGLLLAGLFRIAIGLVVLRSARLSRFPTTFRVFGVIVIVAGVMTPFFGVARARLLVAALVTRGPLAVRLVAAAAIALGGFIAYGFS